MSRQTELAWAAGFFDGEGHTGPSNHGGVQMMVMQCGTSLLERFRDAVGGVGRIRLRKHATDRWQAGHEWRIWRKEDVRQVAQLLWPYLSWPKREQWLRSVALDQMNRSFFGRGRHPRNAANLVPLTPETAANLGRRGSARGLHQRWHVQRGIVSSTCSLCFAASGAQAT